MIATRDPLQLGVRALEEQPTLSWSLSGVCRRVAWNPWERCDQQPAAPGQRWGNARATERPPAGASNARDTVVQRSVASVVGAGDGSGPPCWPGEETWMERCQV